VGSKQLVGESVMSKWICLICGFVYDEAKGLPNEGIPPGTPWSLVPDSWKCPDCGVGKSSFKMIRLD
jgi:rubredoxin